MNIKLTLTIRFTAVVVLLLTSFSLVVYNYYANYRKTTYYERLFERSNLITRIYIDSVDLKKIESRLRPLDHFSISIWHEDKLIIQNGYTPSLSADERLQFKKKSIINLFKGDTAVIGFPYQFQGKNYLVLASSIDKVGGNKLGFLFQVILLSLIISVVFLMVLGWFFADLLLSPIKKLIREADQISVSNLHKRLPSRNNKDELAKLSQTFNNMLDRLEASFVMQKNFVSNASHEFRTPITAMKAQIEVMLSQERSKEEYIDTLKSIEEDIDQFMQLVISLSELAKTDIAAQSNSYEKIPFIEVVAESRAELLRSKPRYNISLQINSLPETEEENYVLGNGILIKSAIKNLMENACKFSIKQQCEVTILFIEGKIVTTITDEGIGISVEELPLIFEPFYRANDTRGIAGHGIGLSLVKKIIDLHQGTIKVESTPSVGTKMIVSLPNVNHKHQDVDFKNP